MRVRHGLWIRAIFASAIVFAGLAGPAAAETPIEVVEAIADDGVYIAPGFEIDGDTAEMAVAIAQARRQGIKIVAIAPNEPLPDAEAFGLRVLQASGAAGYDAVLVFTEDGDHQIAVVDEYKDRILRSIQAAQQAPNAADSISAVATALLAEPEPSVPAAIDVVSGWVFTLIAILAAAVILDVIWRQQLRRRYRERIANAQTAQSQTAQSKTVPTHSDSKT